MISEFFDENHEEKIFTFKPGDRLVLMETQPREAAALSDALGREKLVSVLESDGYAALKAHLPPRENRGLVLIDPPYESDLEFDRVLAGIELAHERWPTGTLCVWYHLTERAGPARFHRDLERSGIRRVLDVQLRVLPDPSNMARDLFDAGRSVLPGRRESFKLRAPTSQAPARLIIRTAPVDKGRLEVSVNSQPVGFAEVTAVDGWSELSVPLPPWTATGQPIRVTLVARDMREWTHFHTWLVERP